MRPSLGSYRASANAPAATLVATIAWLFAGCVYYVPPSGGQDGEPGAAGRDAALSASTPLGPLWRTAGFSVQGRALRVTTIGQGPRRVLWVGGIHGNEIEGKHATQQLPVALTAIPGAREQVALTILEDVNPDGRELNIRSNANGVDLNRNFPADNFKPHRMFGVTPLSQPEAKALHDLILEVDPHLVIVAHSWRGDWFINYDGPGDHLANRFSRLSSYPVRPSNNISPTPGSLGSWVGRKLGIPILTLEYLRGRDPYEAWRETKAAILAVILDA